MTATLTQVRAALKTRLESITGLEVHAFASGTVNPPAAVVSPAPGEFLTYYDSSGTHRLDLVVALFVQLGEDQSASEELDAYIAPTGTKSIAAAVQSDPTLGGVVDSAEVESARNFGPYTYNDVQYLGCEFPVSVLL